MTDHESIHHETVAAELVAYLDGELETNAARSVESRLANDAAYRRQLEELQRAWQMLDFLDKPDVSETFASSTLEMTVIAARDDARTQRIKAGRRQMTTWLLAVGCCVLSLVAGFVLITLLVRQPNRRLIRDLALIENVDYYTYGGRPGVHPDVA